MTMLMGDGVIQTPPQNRKNHVEAIEEMEQEGKQGMRVAQPRYFC